MAISKEEFVEQELIPGLPDQLVTHFILPRLTWYTRPCMLSISKAWKSAIFNGRSLNTRTKELYRPCGLFLIHELRGNAMCVCDEEQLSKSPSARLSSQDSDDDSLDIFLLQKYAIEMCDMRDKLWHRLPPIPSCPSGIPSRCSFVCWDGKLFVMGGIPDSSKAKESADMHMLNIGLYIWPENHPISVWSIPQGHWWWEKCASMHFSRAYLKCAARDGYIYVVGGTCPAEVYNVNDNTWHRLPEMVDVQFFCNGILALDNQIYAYGYDILDQDVLAQPDVTSARVFDLLSRTWSSVRFDFSKCCTSASGHLMLDILDGTLVTYDAASHNTTLYDGKLHDQVDTYKGNDVPLSFYVDNDYIYHPSCQVVDLVVVDSLCRKIEVYTLVSPYGFRLHQLWHGTIDFDTCKVIWDQDIICPFKLFQLDSENLSEICYMS